MGSDEAVRKGLGVVLKKSPEKYVLWWYFNVSSQGLLPLGDCFCRWESVELSAVPAHIARVLSKDHPRKQPTWWHRVGSVPTVGAEHAASGRVARRVSGVEAAVTSAETSIAHIERGAAELQAPELITAMRDDDAAVPVRSTVIDLVGPEPRAAESEQMVAAPVDGLGGTMMDEAQ